MEIGGKALGGLAKRMMSLPRGNGSSINLMITALPLGFEEKAERVFPSPSPPRQFVMRGKKIMRDPKTMKPLTEPDFENHEYKQASRTTNRLQMVLYFYEAVKSDPDVTFSTQVPSDDAAAEIWAGFYLQLLAELQRSGFTSGDLKQVFDVVAELSNMGDVQVEEAVEDFLPEE
jgi:hypothetical protein